MLISLSVVRYGTGTAVINILRRMFLAEQRNKTSRSSNTTYTTAQRSVGRGSEEGKSIGSVLFSFN